MDYIGLFALGAFVGAMATYGLRFVKDYRTFAKSLTVIIAATLSGTVMLFLDRFAKIGEALGAYSVGLLIALMWAFVSKSVERIKSPERSVRLLGIAHIAACVLVTAVAVALVLPPAFRQVWTEGTP